MINYQLDVYLNWLMGLIEDEGHLNYTELCRYLMSVDFRWSVRMDENRAADGVHLRLVFEDQTGYSFDNKDAPCTVLEMMIALALRGGEDILWDGENNWTPFIFWTMIENLGLKGYTDEYFLENRGYSDYDLEVKINNFLDRNYDKYGHGGLFYVVPKNSHFPKNFQKLEIWYQMAAWINDNFV